MGLERIITLGAWAVTALFFFDAPWLTTRQAWVSRRSRPRAFLLATELGLTGVWIVATAAGWRPRLLPEPSPVWAGMIGAVVAILGLGLSVWAKVRLGRWFSATFGVKQGHELVTDGPYAVTRHPIYSGVLIGLVGSALVWNLASLLLLTVALSVTLYGHTLHEEALFVEHFGDAYRDYRRRVPRLVPFVGLRRATKV